MSCWIFQNTPDLWDLREEFIEGREGWHTVSRYADQMEPGDIVFFWMAGPASIRGIYGWGKLTSTPYRHREPNHDVVNVRYVTRLRAPLLAVDLKVVPELKSLSILRAPQGSNFPLSYQEARAIVRLIEPDQRPPM
jgi:predicted RNA-binding protein with PUA-like domain